MIIITGPSLDINHNVSGISEVVKVIIKRNKSQKYLHFIIGRQDIEKRNLFYLIQLAKILCKWVSLLLKNKNALIHYNLPLDKFSVLRDFWFISVARILRSKIVIHLHGGKYLICRNNSWLFKFFIKILLSGDCQKITLSESDKEFLSCWLNIKNLHVLPNAVDIENVAAEKKYNLNDGPIILFLGRIELNKGIHELYNALAQLKEMNFSFRFVLAGNGPERDNAVRKFEDLLKDKFEFLGSVSGEKKTNVLKNADIFVLPSYFEGLPMALLESMGFGVVPIATSVGSIVNVVTHGDNGFLVAVKDYESIVDHLKMLINEPRLLREMSRSATNTIYKKFSTDTYFQKLNYIYQSAS